MPDMNIPHQPNLRHPTPHLAPATITAIAGRTLELDIEGRQTLATLAVAGLYTPAIGDEVLVIESTEAYVIGVLHSSAPLTITAPGDLRLLAPNGTLTLTAAALTATAPHISLNAKHLTLAAERLRESFQTVRRTVTDFLDLDIAECRARIAGLFSLRAQSATITATDNVSLDAPRIDLG